MELYSGQGRITLKKLGDDSPQFFLGNVPRFEANFRTGELELIVDELRDESLEIICGSAMSQSSDVSSFEIGEGSPFEYELTFDAVNTAGSNSRWRVKLDRVKFTPSEGWDLISEGFSEIKIRGMAYADEHGKRGAVHRLHKESVTGNRLTDAKQEVSA